MAPVAIPPASSPLRPLPAAAPQVVATVAASAPPLAPVPSGTTASGPSPLAAPVAPTVYRNISPAVFNRISARLHEATRDLIDGTDLALGIMTVFLSFGASMKRLGGKVQPDEAAALVRSAARLPAEQRRVLAAAIQYGMASGAIEPAGGGEGHPKSEVNATFAAFIAANTPNADETKVGTLLGASDALVNEAHRTFLDVPRKGDPARAVDTADLEAAQARFEAAMTAEGIPPSMAAAARSYVRARIGAENRWPAHQATYPGIDALHTLLNRSPRS